MQSHTLSRVSKERFLRKLKENLTALHVSGHAYDLGLDCEAAKIGCGIAGFVSLKCSIEKCIACEAS